MRSLVLCIFVIALVGGGICGRLRRQAPIAGFDAGIMGSPPEGVGADMDGAPAEITTMGSDTKVDGLNSALGMMLTDVNNQAAMGVPVDPKKVDKILKMTLIIGLVGGDVSEANKEGIADILTAPPPPPPPAA